MLTKKEPEGEPAPARQTGCYSWIHQNIPLEVVERGERIFSFPPHLSAWCLPESAAPCWSSKDPRSFPAKWLQFVIRAVCPWRFSAGSLASPSLRPGHRWCPYPPSTFKRRAQGQAVSAGKFLGLSIFLRSQRSPPGPLFMWDIMLFHFPLVILLPWRELDSWYNYMLGQFPVKVTPCRCPIPGPESTALGQKPGGPLCRAGNDSVLGGHFAWPSSVLRGVKEPWTWVTHHRASPFCGLWGLQHGLPPSLRWLIKRFLEDMFSSVWDLGLLHRKYKCCHVSDSPVLCKASMETGDGGSPFCPVAGSLPRRPLVPDGGPSGQGKPAVEGTWGSPRFQLLHFIWVNGLLTCGNYFQG